MTATTTQIREYLFSQRDEKYADFTASLIPTTDRKSIIGVRTPILRKYAKGLSREDAEAFMRSLPHKYYEENNLHAFLICGMRDYDAAISEVERFLPCVDNWATCDCLRPKVFKKHTGELYTCVNRWLDSGLTYTVRYAVGMLCSYFLDDAFSPAHLALAAGIESDEYYINMMVAWYFATALAKQRMAALPYFTEGMLHEPVLSMARRKACESFRVPDDDKALLRRLRKQHDRGV